MCGRFLSLSSTESLAERFSVDEVRTDPLPARYNVAPSTEVYAVIDHDAQRRLGTLRWGFLPHWARSTKGGRQPINARLETVATSRMFAPSFERRRCLLPADGFYEWQARDEGRRKQPYHLADPDGDVLAFAGIWSLWRDPSDEAAAPLATTAILTTAARGEMERIHDRMPVVVPERFWATYLRTGTDEAPHLLETIRGFEVPRLVATPISDRVNSVRNDGPDLLEPGTVDD